ncbi:hypothetical protein [Serratia sp. JSRIV006]|uniref:hypothetical protein n=1 Tax=Serratia sp. JSRIV006 TaxID=2831896 RepID=UPI001CBFE449|nr:hypothetical protein [Serratia sp. JSRIV006]UAN64258.1 hypothetical protein KGP16_06700 [Serratia sp. JSRIV006]
MNVLTYEQLKQRLDAVVAECAELRAQSEEVYAAGYNHGHLNTVDGIAYTPGTKDEFYSLALRVMAEVETPNVTAALAEVEAKAIEKGIERITIIMNHQAPAVAQVIKVLEAYTVELREGRV